MSQTKKKIAVIGGDLRQISAAEELERAGFDVALYGFDTYGEKPSEGLEKALSGAEILLLPMPIARNEYLNMPFSESRMTPEELLRRLGEDVSFAVGGMFSAELKSALEGKKIKAFDLCEDERFNIMNSIPTAEGAIAIAMSNMQITLNGSHAAVIGFGRIGKTLCRSLQALGVKVTAVARSPKDLALSEIYGYRAVDHRSFPALSGEMDVIFNTVPHTVVTEEIQSGMKKDAFVIDLASKPGGVDSAAAIRQGIRVIAALSLPGKVAPITAGKIIAKCTVEKLSEVIS